jgi:hypothetical protein
LRGGEGGVRLKKIPLKALSLPVDGEARSGSVLLNRLFRTELGECEIGYLGYKQNAPDETKNPWVMLFTLNFMPLRLKGTIRGSLKGRFL